jgi:hypothetical protein
MHTPYRSLMPWIPFAVVFSNNFTVFGSIFLLFSVPFVRIFVLESTFFSELTTYNTTHTLAKVTEITGTDNWVNGVQVLQVSYKYKVDGNEYTGHSYFQANEPMPETGQTISVEYRQDRPHTSRLPGAKSAPFGNEGLFVLIFPAAGLIFLVIGLYVTRPDLSLLKYGRRRIAKLGNKTPTNMTINKRTVMRCEFEYQDADGRQQIGYYNTHTPEKLQNFSPLEILALPEKTQKVLVIGAYTVRIRPESTGDISIGMNFGNVASLILMLALIGSFTWLIQCAIAKLEIFY